MKPHKFETTDDSIDKEIAAIERDLGGSELVKKLKSKSSSSKKLKSLQVVETSDDPFNDSDDDIFEGEEASSLEEEEEEVEDFVDDDSSPTGEEDNPSDNAESRNGSDKSPTEEDEEEGEEEEEPTIMEIPDDEKDMVIAYSKNCSRCAYLVGWAKEHFDDCHYTNGNTACPAQMIKIVLGFPINKAARSIAKSILNQDVIKTSKRMRHLKKADPAIQSRVMKEVKKLVAIGDTTKFPVIDDLQNALILKKKPKRKVS